MTKPMTTSPTEKPPAEEVVYLPEEDDDDDSGDDDAKKNIYNEIPEYDDVDEVKLAVEGLDHLDSVSRQQNLANENLYSEIRPNDERFENALYMANEKQNEEKQKSVVVGIVGANVFPSMSPKTRSFFPAAPLPSIPSSSKMIAEEPEPSWCCGTRRRRRRSLVLGLFLTTLFLLFLCVALLVRMYVPPAGDDDDQGFGLSTAEFLHHDFPVSSADDWETGNRVVTTQKPPEKTEHSESICTSWQGKRRLDLRCPTSDGVIQVVRAFYGWSQSEAVCRQTTGDTYCKIKEDDVGGRCNGDNSCEFWADASGWTIGCRGWHDYLQVDFYCVRP